MEIVRRLIGMTLVGAIVVGCVLVWRTNQERAQLRAEYARLAREMGDLRLTDPTKVHITALETGDPHHFAWRVYAPQNYRQSWCVGRQSEGRSSVFAQEPKAEEFIYRLHVREDRGAISAFQQRGAGSTVSSTGDPALAQVLRDRWNEVEVTQVGRNGVAVIDPADSVMLLRLGLSPAMQKDPLIEKSRYLNQYVPGFLELWLGPKPFTTSAPIKTLPK